MFFPMIFHVTWLKEDKEAKHSIDILVDISSEALLRDFLTYHHILILGIKPYKQEKSFFGKVYFLTTYKNEIINITCYLENIEKACTFFSLLGFDILDINYITESEKISSEESKTILQKIKTQAQEMLKKIEQENIQKQQQKQAIYEDEKLQKMKQVIEQVMFQKKELVEKIEGRISPTELKLLQDEENELNKLRLGRNYEKMSEVVKKIVELMGNIESEYLKYMEKNKYFVLPDSIVTNIDIIMENERFKKAKRVQQLGAKKDKNDQRYIFFWELWIYVKFLRKDILQSGKNISSWIKKWYVLMIFVYSAILIEMAIYLRFSKISYATEMNQWIYITLINIATRWIVWYFINLIKIKKNRWLAIVLPAAFIIHAGIYRLIINNFAL